MDQNERSIHPEKSAGSDGPQKLNIFDYDDYRQFLKDYYLLKKKQTKYFSYRYFSLKTGFSSHNILKKIICGQRNISVKNIPRFSKALLLAGDEAEYFQLLVLHNQSKSETEKNILLKEMSKFKERLNVKMLTELQLLINNEWYNIALTELIKIRDLNQDYETMARALHPHITPEQVKEAIQLLENIEMIKRDENGKLVEPYPFIQVPEPFRQAELLKKSYIQFYNLGLNAYTTVSNEKQYIRQVTFALSPTAYKNITAFMSKFLLELNDMLQKDTEPPKSVYQFNLHLFPLTDPEMMPDQDKQ